MAYCVFDIETTYGESKGRVGNRWDEEFGLCSVGFKYTGDNYEGFYTVDTNKDRRMGIMGGMELPIGGLSGISCLVGHNIKFDLLWYWDHPELIDFLKRGGVVWDTMYAEYLLSGQFYNSYNHTYPINLKDTAARRGCEFQKLDVVKALWEIGVRTEDIDEDILMEYMKYDILTTEELYLKQLAQAAEQDQVVQIRQRMEGLLATTEMEYNGLYIDQETAEKQQKDLEDQIETAESDMYKVIPVLPDDCEFNWSSWRNVSALLFGGYIKYETRDYSLDKDDNKQYYKMKVREASLDILGNKVYFKSGKNKGKLKTRLVSVPDYDRGAKTKLFDKYYKLKGVTEPRASWASSVDGYFSTDADVMEALDRRGVDIAHKITFYGGLVKDLGTYYKRFNKGKWTGMLTNIQDDGFVHGHLNHTITKTGRLSSSKPNLQNISKEGKSEIKRVFSSRFPYGVIAELDYAQLEVVCKGVLSGDEGVLAAVSSGLDEHCEWLSFATGKPYDDVVHLCKVLEDPEWIEKRQNIKPLTFSKLLEN